MKKKKKKKNLFKKVFLGLCSDTLVAMDYLQDRLC